MSRSSRVGLASTALAGNVPGARLGPIPRTTILSVAPPGPLAPLSLRRKPAMTMLSPVLTKARVLRLASFESTPWLRS